MALVYNIQYILVCVCVSPPAIKGNNLCPLMDKDEHFLIRGSTTWGHRVRHPQKPITPDHVSISAEYCCRAINNRNLIQ